MTPILHAGAARHGYVLAKILLVLDPIQLNLEAGELGGIDMAVLDQFVESFDDVGRGGYRSLGVEVIQLQDHRSVTARARTKLVMTECS